MSDTTGNQKAAIEICNRCRRQKRRDCDGDGWLDAIGPCRDGSYITSRPCPNDDPIAGACA